MEIRAYAVPQKGAAPVPFSYRAEMGAHDVLVKLTHRSITRGDLQLIENDWGDARFPLVPSHEMVGIVDRTGSRVTELKAGERVGVGFQLDACFECTFCRRGTEQFCSRQTVVGVNAYGGLAEHIVVDARFAFPLPPQLSPAPSTPLMSSGLTVFAAITYAQLPHDARVAVLGIGGLGRLALRFLRAMGHRVSAFSRSPEKRRTIEQLGAEYVDGADSTSLASFRNTFDLVLSTLNVARSIIASDRSIPSTVQHDRNEWATSFERALAPGEAWIARSPAARQPFSLGDPDAVRHILDSAGFAAPTFDEVRAPVYYGSDVDAAFEFVSRFAVVQETAARLDVRQRERALERLRHLLAAHRRADGVWFDSRAWIVASRRS